MGRRRSHQLVDRGDDADELVMAWTAMGRHSSVATIRSCYSVQSTSTDCNWETVSMDHSRNGMNSVTSKSAVSLVDCSLYALAHSCLPVQSRMTRRSWASMGRSWASMGRS